TMPRMSGRDAFRHMMEIDPDARILFSTGYSADDLTEVDGSLGLLSKPYRPQELVAAVRAALISTSHPVGWASLRVLRVSSAAVVCYISPGVLSNTRVCICI